MVDFNKSISFDKELWAADIRGSIAYANALVKPKLINEDERKAVSLCRVCLLVFVWECCGSIFPVFAGF